MPQETMTKKEKRMMEAARLKHMEDMSNSEIAKHIGVAEGTVCNYFSSDQMQQFQRFYSDQELYQLQQSLEQDVQDGNELANDLLSRAIGHPEAKPSTLVRASKEAQKIRERKIEMLQELGVIQKPKERKEVEKTETDDTREKLAEYYEEKESDVDA
ncbi:hypothetical protein OSG_eHP23_00155 [environmental Halophage eHP-23]|nr:hypothetical protein OSG_eHP23_00155 [environmental Halophage eHP-23]